MWKGRWRVVIKSNKPQANKTHLPPAVAKLSATPSPLSSPLPGSHLAHHSGTPPSSPFTRQKRAINPGQEEMVKHITALGAFCWPPTTLPPLLSPAFHPFLPLCPLCNFPTSPTALTCTFWPTASLPPLARRVEKYHHLMVTQSLNAGCHLDLLLSYFGW